MPLQVRTHWLTSHTGLGTIPPIMEAFVTLTDKGLRLAFQSTGSLQRHLWAEHRTHLQRLQRELLTCAVPLRGAAL